MQIAVAHAGRFDLDEDFTRAWRIELGWLDRHRLPAFPQDCSGYLHKDM
jgi:hypothetical protein